MAKYQDLLKQIESLQKEADSVRKEELRNVIAEIKQKMADFGLTVEDLGGKSSAGGARKGGSVKPKYRDPASGATWTGRGRAPKWVSEAEERGVKRDTFLI